MSEVATGEGSDDDAGCSAGGRTVTNFGNRTTSWLTNCSTAAPSRTFTTISAAATSHSTTHNPPVYNGTHTSLTPPHTVGWIKMKLGMVVGLDPGHIVLDRDPAPRRKGEQQPPHHFWNLQAQAGRLLPYNLQPMCIVAKRMDGSRCHLVRR